MLLFLRDDLRHCAAQEGEPGERARVALENLLLSSREGKHLVTATPATARALLDQQGFSLRSRGTLRSIIGRAADVNSLRSSLPIQGRIIPDGPSAVVSARGITLIDIPLCVFEDSASAQATTLLCENLTDCQAYIALANASFAQRRWRGIQARAEFSNGGGGTTAAVLRHMANQDRICLCVVDSDRRHPTDRVGSTARDVSAANDEIRPFQAVHVLSSRELENLLSVDLFVAAYTAKGATSNAGALDRIKELEQKAPGEWRAHCDLKEGVLLWDVTDGSPPPHTALAQFWLEFATEAGARCGLRVCHADALKCDDRADCTCTLVPAVGLHALEVATEWMLSQSYHKVAELLDWSAGNDLQRASSLVGSWCCAPYRSVT